MQARISEGGAELALLYDFNLDPRFEKLSLLSLPPYVLLPESHRLALQASINLNDLVTDPLITFDQPDHWHYLRSLFPDRGPTVARKVNNVELIRGLVAAGKGYSILNTRSALDQACDGSPVACIPISGVVPPAPIVLASGRKSHTSRAIAFIETCRSILDTFDVQEGKWLPERNVIADRFPPSGVPPDHGLSDVIG